MGVGNGTRRHDLVYGGTNKLKPVESILRIEKQQRKEVNR